MVGITSPRNYSQQHELVEPYIPPVPVTKAGRITRTDQFILDASQLTLVTTVRMLVDATGGDTDYAIVIKKNGESDWNPISEYVGVGKIATFEGVLALNLGDVISGIGDEGATNGTLDYTITYTEPNKT